MVNGSYSLQRGDPPESKGVELKDQGSDLQEQRLVCVVTELLLGLVGRNTRCLIKDRLNQDEGSLYDTRRTSLSRR